VINAKKVNENRFALTNVAELRSYVRGENKLNQAKPRVVSAIRIRRRGFPLLYLCKNIFWGIDILEQCLEQLEQSRTTTKIGFFKKWGAAKKLFFAFFVLFFGFWSHNSGTI